MIYLFDDETIYVSIFILFVLIEMYYEVDITTLVSMYNTLLV